MLIVERAFFIFYFNSEKNVKVTWIVALKELYIYCYLLIILIAPLNKLYDIRKLIKLINGDNYSINIEFMFL